MRPQKFSDQEVIEGLFNVLRADGYDGAALTDLTLATGLKKASLYHRFPGGKLQITQEVLQYVLAWSEQHIVKVLSNKDVEPQKRLNTALKNIKELYEDGNTSCIFRSLTTDRGLGFFGSLISQGFEMWLVAFETIGKDLGFKRKESRQMALDSVIKIQGSLVVGKALQTNKPFLTALNQIRNTYLP